MRGSLISQLTNGALRCQRSFEKTIVKNHTALLLLPLIAASKLFCIVSRASATSAARAISELIWALNNSLILLVEYAIDYCFKRTSDYGCNTNPPYKVHGEHRCINFRKGADIRFFAELCPSFSGAEGRFCDRGGLKIYAMAIWARWHPSELRTAHFSREFRVHAPQEKFLRLKFSEISSVFWTLKFNKCLYSILNM